MRKFPFHRQLDAMDCGSTCLRMVAQWYGKAYSLQYLREHSYITRSGVSMLGISDAAESIGFRTGGYRMNFEQLQDVPLPFIVHWNSIHFVVVYNIRKNGDKFKVDVADPAAGLLVYDKPEFLKFWLSTEKEQEPKGHILTLEPTPDFYSHEEVSGTKLKIGYLLNYLRPYRKYFIQLILGMLTGSIISLIFPFLTQSIVDVGIGTGNLPFILLILVAQLLLAIGQTANDLIRSWIMLHVTTRISIALISDFLIKLMRLPISFFDIKLIGDIMQRHRRPWQDPVVPDRHADQHGVFRHHVYCVHLHHVQLPRRYFAGVYGGKRALHRLGAFVHEAEARPGLYAVPGIFGQPE